MIIEPPSFICDNTIDLPCILEHSPGNAILLLFCQLKLIMFMCDKLMDVMICSWIESSAVINVNFWIFCIFHLGHCAIRLLMCNFMHCLTSLPFISGDRIWYFSFQTVFMGGWEDLMYDHAEWCKMIHIAKPN